MRKLLILTILSLYTALFFAQPPQSLNENEPLAINGIEYTRCINQGKTKKAGDNEYGRYVLELYTVNKSDCDKYIPYKNEVFF